ncbi:hypothetical protein ACMFMG_002451 [Clarireedia jacksonii]
MTDQNLKENIDAEDDTETTALISAATRGDSKTVSSLLEAGADPKALDESGRIALSWAVKNNHVAVVKQLLNDRLVSRGIEAGRKDIQGRDSIHFAAMRGIRQSRRSLMVLIDKGPKINEDSPAMKDKQGQNALHHGVFTTLLEAYPEAAEKSPPDHDGWTPYTGLRKPEEKIMSNDFLRSARTLR